MRAAQGRAPDHVVHPQVAAVGELPGDLPLPSGLSGLAPIPPVPPVSPAPRLSRAAGTAAGAGGWPGRPGARVGVLTPPSLRSAAEIDHGARRGLPGPRLSHDRACPLTVVAAIRAAATGRS